MASGRRVARKRNINGRTFEDGKYDLQAWLEELTDSNDDGIPPGFNETTPNTVTVDGTPDPGTENAGWMAADAQLVVESDTPADLGEATAAGGSDKVADAAHVHKLAVRVAKAGATVGTRKRINFIEGAGVTLTIGDDSGNDEVDVTIAAAVDDPETLAWLFA